MVTRRSCLLLLAASLISAQSPLTGPSLGFILDPRTQALRTIWGIPGAATVGENVDLGLNGGKAVFSPAQDYALVAAPDGTVNLILLSKLRPSKIGQGGIKNATRRLTNVASMPDLIALSPSGRAAAFVNGTLITIVHGLPELQDSVEQIDVSVLSRTPIAIALSDDGEQVLVSIPDGTESSAAGGVYAFSRGSGTPRIVAPAMAAGLAFVADSHDALIADASVNSVTALRDVGGATSRAWVFADERLPGPTLVRVVPAGRIVLVSPQSGTIALLNRDGTNPLFLSCTCSPTKIEPLTSSVYQVSDSLGGVVWILDLTSDPRLLFVPIPDVPIHRP